LAISPIAGAVLDRVGPTTAIKTDLIASALLMMGVSIAGWSGWANPPVLFVLVMLFSLTSPMGASSIRTLLPRLVPPAALDRANALDTAIYAVVDVLGPGLAGLAVAWLGSEPAMLLVAAAYAGAVLCLSRVRRLPGLGGSQASLLRQTIEGVETVARQPTLRGLAISYSLDQVTWGVLIVVVPVFAADHFAPGVGSSVAGIMWAAMGVAGGVGALVAGHMRTAGRERYIMAVGMVVTALAAWPVAAEFGFGGLAIGLMLTGWSSPQFDRTLGATVRT
jgi:MFS family permease